MTTSGDLSFLIGRYVGAESMYASTWAPAGRATSTITGTSELGGALVVQRYTQYRDDRVSFASVGVWMTDPASGEFLYYAFDSAGFPAEPPARGGWQNGDVVLERTTARGSSRLVVRSTTDGWSWSKAFRAPGARDWSPMQDATFSPA